MRSSISCDGVTRQNQLFESVSEQICCSELDSRRPLRWTTPTNSSASVNRTSVNIFRSNVLSEAKVDHNEFTLWLRVFCLNVGIAKGLPFHPGYKSLHSPTQYQVSKQCKTNLFDSGLAGALCAIEILRNKESFFVCKL